MRHRQAPLLLAALSLLLAAEARADESTACAQQMVYNANDQGYRLRSEDTDSLVEGHVMNYNVTLSRNVEYVILACGDRYAQDLDIYVYDENGNLIDRDRATDNRPVVKITPIWTGSFLVRVRMYSASGRADYTMALLYR